MTTDIEKAMVEAHRELIAAELTYCRAAAKYAGFIARHSTTPEEQAKWRGIHDTVVSQYQAAQKTAIVIGMVETGEALTPLEE